MYVCIGMFVCMYVCINVYVCMHLCMYDCISFFSIFLFVYCDLDNLTIKH